MSRVATLSSDSSHFSLECLSEKKDMFSVYSPVRVWLVSSDRSRLLFSSYSPAQAPRVPLCLESDSQIASNHEVGASANAVRPIPRRSTAVNRRMCIGKLLAGSDGR